MSPKEFIDNLLSPREFIKKTLAPTKYSNGFSYEDLMNAESELGRTLFGPVPYGHQREFFKSREKNIWIWHESWVAGDGTPGEITIRYEVRPEGVFKRANNGSYTRINGVELDNFRQAARSYLNLIKTNLYS